MRARLAWAVAVWAAAACGDSHGPPPAVRLDLRGRVQSAQPTPVPISGAHVALRHFRGLLGDPETLEATSTDRLGNFRLTYIIISLCDPEDNTTYWLEAAADGYETISTFAADFSDPVIRCTDAEQAINFSLPPSSASVLPSRSTIGRANLAE